MARRIGFGIIGIGIIGKTHALAINNNDNCSLVSAYHPDMGKVRAFSDKYGCKRAYDDLESFLSDPELEVVAIATPSGAHLDPALAAINHGKHVLIEKPLEISPQRCRMIIDAAREKGVLVGGIFQSRFYDASRLVKKAVEEGRFGRLTLVDAQVKWFRSQDYYDSGAWRGTWAMDGGGVLMNQGIHAIDLLQWLTGKVSEVQAYTATLSHERIEVEDNAVAALRFENGALGVIEGSTSLSRNTENLKRLELCGTDGTVVLEENMLKVWSFNDERPEDEMIRRDYQKGFEPFVPKLLGHERQFQDMADAIINGREPEVTGEAASESVKIVCSIYESVRERRPVKVD